MRDLHGAALLGVALLLVVPARAQHDRLQQVVQRAIADLAEPAKVADAVRVLENLGPAVVPALRERLHWSRRPDTPVPVQLQALYVLGRLGRDAVQALPEVRDVIGADDSEVANQALWTLSRLLPFLRDDACDAVRDQLRRMTRLDGTSLAIAVAQTRLGSEPSPAQMLANLRFRDVTCIAACRWLVAHADEDFDGRQRVFEALCARRERAMVRELLPWKDRSSERFVAVDLAEAWLAMSKQPLDAMAARALLDHWHVDSRRRAMLWLQDHGAALPLGERADLVGRLWDVDPTIIASTAESFAAWGAAGLVALAPLRLMQRTQANPELAKRCGEAAERVCAACRGMAAADRALLATIDAALQLQPPPAGEPAACTPAGMQLGAEILAAVEWSGGDVCSRVLEACERAGACDATVVRAVFSLVMSQDAAVACAAFACLARRGGAVRSAFDGTDVNIDEELAWLTRFGGAEGARTCAVEAAAWILVHDRTPLLDVRGAIDSGNLRLVVRGLAENVRRNAPLTAGLDVRLQALAALPAGQQLVLHLDGVEQDRVLPIDLRDPVRRLAAVALAQQGRRVEAKDLDDLVRSECGVGLADLPAQVTVMGRPDLLALLDRFEADCRLRLGVPAELAWPRAEPARR
ncbi:MAG TPA: hypothetical protein VFZ65_22295 [Planctomycetota bacterium]|nr:hypothetical protein [Planctomycetota bacterium]